MKTALLVPLTLLLSATTGPGRQETSQAKSAREAFSRKSGRVPLPADRRPGGATITAEQCREWLGYLAADDLAGRATGTPGFKKAADYVAAHFAEFGLEPVGDDGTYFQAVPWARLVAVPAQTSLRLLDSTGKAVFEVRAGEGLGGSLTEQSKGEYDLVFLKADAADAVGDDLEGKAVLLLDESRRRGRWSPVARALMRARPGVVVAIDDAQAKQELPVRTRFTGRGRRTQGRFRRPNRFAITEAAARLLLEGAGVEADLIGGKPGATPVPDVRLATQVTIRQEAVFAANVVGLLRGRDPQLATEIVGVGSHLDHIGTRGGQINNGADDDGSGTTGVLAVARAFSKNPHKPRRSLLFMCFAGEENGLIGSRYYTENPIFPNASMVAELQMDMIGRNEERVDRRTGEILEGPEENENSLHLIGTKKLSMELHELCVELNREHVGFDLEYDEEDVFYRSDHANFARQNIPIAFFFTGFHPQYHRPDDTVDRINFPKLVRVAQLVYAIAFELAEQKGRPSLDREWKDIPQTRGRRRR